MALATLYRVWYDMNGGTNGGPSEQMKTHGVSLTLRGDSSTGYRKVVTSMTEATKEYTLKEWNTAADGSGTRYALGGTYTANAPLKLYAVWQLKYVYPFISNLKVIRTKTSSLSDIAENDDGTYIYISFDWTGCSTNAGSTVRTPNCQIKIGDDTYTPTLSSNFAYKPSTQYATDVAPTVEITLYDSQYSSSSITKITHIGTSIMPIDLYDDGTNVYMGVMTAHKQGQALKLLVDAIYPVGCYYETSLRPPNTNETGTLGVDYFSPSEYFGGEWILETAGMVHVAGGTGFPVSKANQASGAGLQDGGQKDAYLPTHGHPLTIDGSVTATSSTNITGGSHHHRAVKYASGKLGSGTVGARIYSANNTTSGLENMNTTDDTHTHSLPHHTHTLSISGSARSEGDGAGTNMNYPPYINVYRWHRTA